MKLRTLIFWPHLLAGLLAGTVVALMSLTGVVLTYERQLIAWSDRQFESVPPSVTAQRLPLSTIVERVRADAGDISPAAITIGADREAPVAIAVPPRTIYVDAYSGARLGEGSQRMRSFMTSTRAWH